MRSIIYNAPGRRTTILFVILVAGLLAAFGEFKLAEKYYVQRELEASARRAAPYLTSLASVLERYQNITPILSEDREIIDVAQGGPAGVLNRRLERFSEATRSEAVYLMDQGGQTIAASNWQSEQTFLGHNYGFRPYFQASLAGETGEYFAVGATTGQPGYFVSHPVRDASDQTIGVIAVKVDLRGLEADWETPEGTVFISNGDGIIVLSARPTWRYGTLDALTPQTRERITSRRQFGTAQVAQIDATRDGRVLTIDGARFVEHTLDVGRLDWRLHFLSPYERVLARSRIVLVITVVALSLILVALLIRRTERIRNSLIVSRREREQLNRLNQDHGREIEERIEAETRLQAAQKELRQTSRLAALGQLAASVTHELGQPLSAMKTYIAGARLPEPTASGTVAVEERGGHPVLDQLDRLVDRMAETTRQLKFFARRGGEDFADIDLADVITGALETMNPAIMTDGAELVCVDTTQTVTIRGGRMRLEQVLINMIRNALDAMQTTDRKKLTIRLRKDDTHARIIVSDTGVGLSGGQETAIFEPFVTTKASGEGLGLGLAISAGIVNEHGGSLSARDRMSGGAEFILELPLPDRTEIRDD
ncbi:MAG: sensor histidine kinase [Rhodospirillaceae bacterium]|nr:sensor histidine kinase [Rhodospirillaceae bacterium]